MLGQLLEKKRRWAPPGLSRRRPGGAENPTLTIVSLAIRQAEYIADEMGKKNI
jgi:hypothetical protein